MDSIGPASQTLMIVNISPSIYDIQATRETLLFAEQTGRIKSQDGVIPGLIQEAKKDLEGTSVEDEAAKVSKAALKMKRGGLISNYDPTSVSGLLNNQAQYNNLMSSMMGQSYGMNDAMLQNQQAAHQRSMDQLQKQNERMMA